MYIPCIPCIFFDSEIAFATDFIFTKAINLSCFDSSPTSFVQLFPFGADIVTSWNINEQPQKFSSDIPGQIIFDFTMLFVTHFIATKPTN